MSSAGGWGNGPGPAERDPAVPFAGGTRGRGQQGGRWGGVVSKMSESHLEATWAVCGSRLLDCGSTLQQFSVVVKRKFRNLSACF